MVDLVPIKVILRHKNADGSPRVDQNGGTTVYPSFRNLPETVLQGRTPSDHIGKDGEGWRYDKVSNLGTGAEFGAAVALVAPDFAAAALATVDSCTVLTEAECKTFLNTRHFVGVALVKRDADALIGLKAERDLKLALRQDVTSLDASIAKALDPTDPALGVRTPDGPTDWDTMKARRSIRVVRPT